MQGKSISLSERISGEKEDKLELPELFKSIALLSAKKQGYQSSSASYTQGACIVDDTNKILSVGQSGYPEIVNDKAIQKDTDEASSVQNDFIAHAEYKAILARGAPSFKGCTLYVTKYPCNGCAQVIVQSGITKVYYIEKGTEGDPFTYDQLNSTKKEEWEEKAEQNMYWASGKIFSKNEVKLEPWEGEIKVELQEKNTNTQNVQ